MPRDFDPTESFVAAFGSVWVRLLLSAAAVFGAYCLHLERNDFEPIIALFWFPVAVGLLLYWGEFGLWFLAGFLAFVSAIVFAYAFAQDWRPSGSFFGVFTSATIFFLPLSIHEERIQQTVICYVGVGIGYWTLFGLYRRFLCR
jgi:hypothetical protein